MNDGNNDPNRVLALFLKPSENKENKRRLDLFERQFCSESEKCEIVLCGHLVSVRLTDTHFLNRTACRREKGRRLGL